MTAGREREKVAPRSRAQRVHRDLRGARSRAAVADPVDRRDERLGAGGHDERVVARLLLARDRSPGDRPLDHAAALGHRAGDSRTTSSGSRSRHLRIVTVVPWPSFVSMSNSSISRRLPGSPRPRPLPVAYPSWNARSTSEIPGPSSRATTTIATRWSSTSRPISTLPAPAWMRMLRPISDIAVAIRVASVREKPSRPASARPSPRATTMSASTAIGTVTSSAIAAVPPRVAVEQGQRLLQVERRLQRLEVEAELDHGHRDVRLDADDDGHGAAQARGSRDVPQRASHERVDDVEGRHVDDDALRPKPTDPVREIVTKLEHLGVAERRLDRGDQVVALLEDRDGHRRSVLGRQDRIALLDDAVSEQALGLLEATLQIANRAHRPEVDAEVDERLRDARRQPGEDRARPHQPGRLDGLHEMVGDGHVDGRDAGDVDDHHLRPVRLDGAEELLGELSRALGVEHPDDRQDQQPPADLEHRRGELADRRLLLANDPLALVDEADADGHGDAVRGRLVGVEDPVEQVGVALVMDEQRPGQDVPQQQDDPEDLMGLDAAMDDPLRQRARVGAQRLDAAGLERVDVVVVHRRHLGEDLLGAHHPQELRVRDPLHPRLEELGAVLAQVGDELREQRGVDLRRLERWCDGAVFLAHCVLLWSFMRLPLRGSGHRGRPSPRAPSRNTLEIAAMVSSAPSAGAAPMTLTTSPNSASVNHAAGTSRRISPSSWPRASRLRIGAPIRSSNPAVPGRARSRARTTKPSPTATKARMARWSPSATAT